MTAHQAIKALCDAVTCAAKGLGFNVAFTIENEIAYADHRPTLVAGLAESLRLLQDITHCANIDPREVVQGTAMPMQQEQKSRIIIAGR